MIGKVSNGQAVLQLKISGLARSIKVTAVIDTGYNGALTLPRQLIRKLRLPRITSSTATLADGSTISFDIFAGVATGNGKNVLIDIDEAGIDPLIGMELMEGSELNVRVKPGGKVTIRPLP